MYFSNCHFIIPLRKGSLVGWQGLVSTLNVLRNMSFFLNTRLTVTMNWGSSSNQQTKRNMK
jgi:hypothetical protein